MIKNQVNTIHNTPRSPTSRRSGQIKRTSHGTKKISEFGMRRASTLISVSNLGFTRLLKSD